MKVTDETVEFIKRWEGFAPKAYWDYHQWSIGYGSPSHEGETITGDVAARRLRSHLRSYATSLAGQLTRDPTPEQSTALLSASYNLGLRGIRNVVAFFNAGDIEKAAALLLQMDHAGGEKLPALTRRREAEARLLEVLTMRGAPREQYRRVYHLLDQDASIDDFVAVAREAYEDRSTIGFSYDDAGIGDLKDRVVVLHGNHPGRIEEWFKSHYPGVAVANAHKSVPVAPKPAVTHTRALWGLHGSADGSWGNPALPPVIEMVKAAKIEAYKALSNEGAMTVGALRRINPDMFFVVRLMGKVDNERSSVLEFVEQCGYGARQWYREGVRYFEIHNEPNLEAEGMWSAWHDGGEFKTWWMNVRASLKKDMPEALWGFPGLSPGVGIDNMRAPAVRFMAEAHEAVTAADWIGVHCYWQTEPHMWTEDGGQYYKRIDTKSPIMITEFSNPSGDVGKAEKAKQYVKYVNSLEGVKAAFAYIASASSGFEDETWTNSAIPKIVGSRHGTEA